MKNKNIKKRCSRCGIEKNIVEFGQDKKTKDGKNRWCKCCCGNLSEKYRKENREKVKRYAKIYCLKNKDKKKEYSKQYRSKKQRELNKKNKQYRLKNKEKVKEWAKQSYLKHIEKRREYDARRYLKRKEYCAKKHKEYRLKNRGRINAKNALERKNNLDVRILHNLRTRINRVLSGISKSAHTDELVGCSVFEVKIYLEKQFEKDMTWDNYGKGIGKWNVDHIVPCSIFNLVDASEQKQCFHFSNLRPLWERGPGGNLEKNDRTNGLNLLYNDTTPFLK